MRKALLNVSVGILARNEEAGIAQVIDDLRQQTLLTEGDLRVQVHVVANACTDRTVEVARQSFDAGKFAQLGVDATVHELLQGGKSNAWNEFIHRIVPDATDFVILLDGDIRIPERRSLKLMVQELAASPNAVVAVDRSVKDIELEQPSGLVEKLIKFATGTATDPRTAIAGACYCVRYSEVRRIWMPIGLPGEDGFLRAMLLTSNFEQSEKLDRLLFVEGAYHVFESMRDLGGVVRHNVRLAIGTAVNILLFDHIRQLREQGVDVSAYVRRRNDEDPGWVNNLIRDRMQASYFPLEARFVSRRLRRMRNSPAQARTLRSCAVAILGAGFDLVVFLRATMLMRKGAGAGYW
uniref:glycosyltransferase n=1 Tax=Altererythrobacter segetis TaxID=1104773 RepID=UPI00140877F9|nr:glycosyltransferase family 2 protein [Altererythrobacter segetis]